MDVVRRCALLMSFVLFPLADASAGTISYQGSGTVDRADEGTNYAVGNTFTFSFDIDESAARTSFVISPTGSVNSRFEQGLLNFNLEFSDGSLLHRPGPSKVHPTDAADPFLDSIILDPWTGFASDPGFVNTLPPTVDEQGEFFIHQLPFAGMAFAFQSNSPDFVNSDTEQLDGFDPTLADLAIVSLGWSDVTLSDSIFQVTGAIEQLTIVPEPGTGTLVGIGLVLSATMRRRSSA